MIATVCACVVSFVVEVVAKQKGEKGTEWWLENRGEERGGKGMEFVVFVFAVFALVAAVSAFVVFVRETEARRLAQTEAQREAKVERETETQR